MPMPTRKYNFRRTNQIWWNLWICSGELETLAEFGSTQPVSLALSAVDAEIGMDSEL